MRNLEGLRVLETAEDVIACITEDPLDRVLDCGSDLSPKDFYGCVSTRADDGILVVRSMRALGATSIDQYVKARRSEKTSYSTQLGELAVIGNEKVRDPHGRIIPKDILALCKAAEDQTPGRLLSWAGYEGLCVLTTHPEAEVGESDWFAVITSSDAARG